MEEGENTWRGQRQREEDRRDMLDQDHLLPLHHLQQQLLDQHSLIKKAMLHQDHLLPLHHLQQQLQGQYSLIRKAMPSQDHLQQQKPHPLAMLVPQV